MLKIIPLLFIIVFALSGCSHSEKKDQEPNNVMVVSVSSDGKYAITSNMNRKAYIWNIKDKTYRAIRVKPVNIYSAFFIPDSHNIIIQNDKTNEVYIEDISGNVIKTFNPGFPVYGEAISSDLKTYVAADELFNIYAINLKDNNKQQLFVSWCNAGQKGSPYDMRKPYQGKLPNGCTGFTGSLPNFHFTPNNNQLVFSIGAPIIIWNFKNNTYKQIIKNTWPNSNAIAPNGNYVVTGDSNIVGYFYNFSTKQGKNFMYNPPQNSDFSGGSITSVNFISQNEFLTTWNAIPGPYLYTTLYNPKYITYSNEYGVKHYINPIKHLPLVKNPNAQYPSDNGLYPQTQSFLPVVATSPSAHILVMAQANGGGIMVYQYHPEEQTLKLIWAPQLK